jgi:hypothetical protein
VISVLPPGHIWLRDAWEQALEALEDYSTLTIELDETWPPNAEEDFRNKAAAACQNARYRVERRMRDALASRELVALALDQKTALPGELPERENWEPMSLLGLGGLGLDTRVGIPNNPGSPTDRPVMLDAVQFQQWLSTQLRQDGRETAGPSGTKSSSKSDLIKAYKKRAQEFCSTNRRSSEKEDWGFPEDSSPRYAAPSGKRNP